MMSRNHAVRSDQPSRTEDVSVRRSGSQASHGLSMRQIKVCILVLVALLLTTTAMGGFWWWHHQQRWVKNVTSDGGHVRHPSGGA